MIVDFLHIRIVLNHYSILEEGSTSRVASHSVEPILGISLSSAAIDADVEVGLLLSTVGSHMNTLALTVVALAEDDAIEDLVKLDAHFHQVLLTFHLEIRDLGHIRSLQRPTVLLLHHGGRG